MKESQLFQFLQDVCRPPHPFSKYTAEDLWNDPHISKRMLAYHLDPYVDVSSRNRDFISRSVEWILRRFDLDKGARVADFGCGPGLYAERLARHGLKVTGIDFSSNSIEHARANAAREGLDIEYIEADYLEFESDRQFDLIMMIMCDFCALSPPQRARVLGKFRSMATPTGTILLDVYGTRLLDGQEESMTCAPNLMDGFWADGEYFGFRKRFKYDDFGVLLDQYTIVEPTRTRRIYNWLQCFTPLSLEKEFASSGLRIVEYLGNVAGDPFDGKATEFAVIAVPV